MLHKSFEIENYLGVHLFKRMSIYIYSKEWVFTFFLCYRFSGTIKNFLKSDRLQKLIQMKTSYMFLLRNQLISIIIGVIEIVWKEALWRRLKVQGDLRSQIPAEWDARRSRYLVLETNATDR